MGFWTRWFGGETREQRIARARAHLAEGEREQALRTLVNLDGDEVEALRREARQQLADSDARRPPAPDDREVSPGVLEEALDDIEAEAPRHSPPLTRAQLRVQLTSKDVGGMLAETVAKRPLGDAVMMLVADLDGASETSLSWAEVEALGLSDDEAFALGRRNAVADVGGEIMTQTLAMPGATCDVAVCNRFYLGGAMLELRTQLSADAPIVVCPLSWHHWLVFQLEPGATRATLAAMRELADQLADGITTIRNISAWVTRSLWWWPHDAAAPEVIDLDAPPAALIAHLGG